MTRTSVERVIVIDGPRMKTVGGTSIGIDGEIGTSRFIIAPELSLGRKDESEEKE